VERLRWHELAPGPGGRQPSHGEIFDALATAPAEPAKIPSGRSEKPDNPKSFPSEARSQTPSAERQRQPDNPNSTGASATAATPPVSPMTRVMAEARCPVILMHNRMSGRDYTDFWPDVLLDLRASIAMARAAGVAENQIWLDPGFGFAKDAAENLEVLRHLGRIAALGHPVLLGTSRKSTIGRVLDEPIPARRGAGTAATLVWGVQQGARMVRIHDVAGMRPFLRMADAIRSGLMWRKVSPSV
jgi:dihydropteroate synthase